MSCRTSLFLILNWTIWSNYYLCHQVLCFLLIYDDKNVEHFRSPYVPSSRRVIKHHFYQNTPKYLFRIYFNFLNIYFWERDSVSSGGSEREKRDTESEADSRLWAVNTKPNLGLKPTNCEIMTWTVR